MSDPLFDLQRKAMCIAFVYDVETVFAVVNSLSTQNVPKPNLPMALMFIFCIVRASNFCIPISEYNGVFTIRKVL